jgi:CBS-domain-containing membrane protein
VVVGHAVSCAAALAVLAALGPGCVSRAAAMAAALAAMMATDSVHPPGCECVGVGAVWGSRGEVVYAGAAGRTTVAV